MTKPNNNSSTHNNTNAQPPSSSLQHLRHAFFVVFGFACVLLIFLFSRSSPIISKQDLKKLREDNNHEKPAQTSSSSQKVASLSKNRKSCDPSIAYSLNITGRVSRCPEDDLYVALWKLVLQLRNKNKNWNIVNVGTNKGYSIAAFLNALEVKPYSKKHLAKDIFKYAFHTKVSIPEHFRWHLAGVCCDPTDERDDIWKDNKRFKEIRDEVMMKSNKNNKHVVFEETEVVSPRHHHSSSKINVYGIDATKSHIDYNKRYFSSSKDISFKFYHTAVSSYKMVKESKSRNYTVEFPQAEIGNEIASILPNASADIDAKSRVLVDLQRIVFALQKVATVNISVTTLDSLIPSSVDQIDVLLSDTEGFDLDVADGARRWLKHGKVGIYILELHRGISSTMKSLGKFVSELAVAGVTCYLPVYYEPKYRRHVVNITPSHSVIDHYLSGFTSEDRADDSDSCYKFRFDEHARGFYNMICAGTKRNPELLDVFEILVGKSAVEEEETNEINEEWRACGLKRLKEEFFDPMMKKDGDSVYEKEVRDWALEGLS